MFGIKLDLQAERSQKKGGMVKCATILVIMCFVMLVLLILKEILLWFFNMNLAYNLIHSTLSCNLYTGNMLIYVGKRSGISNHCRYIEFHFRFFTCRRVLVIPYFSLYPCIGGAYISWRTIVPGTCIGKAITKIGFMVHWGRRIWLCSLGNFVIFISPAPLFLLNLYMYQLN